MKILSNIKWLIRTIMGGWYLVGGVLAILFLGVTILFAVRSIQFAQHGIELNGIVVDWKVSQGEHGDMYAPIFEIQLAGESPVRVTSSVSSSDKTHKLHDKVELVYLPDKEKVITNNFVGKWLFFLLSGVGLLFSGSFAIIGRAVYKGLK